MKSVKSIVLLAVVLFGLVACGGQAHASSLFQDQVTGRKYSLPEVALINWTTNGPQLTYISDWSTYTLPASQATMAQIVGNPFFKTNFITLTQINGISQSINIQIIREVVCGGNYTTVAFHGVTTSYQDVNCNIFNSL